ncbi:MAG: hypothetical protein OXE77_04470 [Flavobacteriaceae bacterium]|nr:hypothetical protein [Flavobacteriaceae bacterium]
MFKIDCTLEFIKKCSRLSKKYPSLKEEVSHLIKSLSDNPKQGDRLKNQCYKIRINIKSKGRGAWGGARLITHIAFLQSRVLILTIYDKAKQSSITQKEINRLINTAMKQRNRFEILDEMGIKDFFKRRIDHN